VSGEGGDGQSPTHKRSLGLQHAIRDDIKM
jgi:hypothetical protein